MYDSFSSMYGCVGVQVSMHEQAHTCEGQRTISGGFLWSTIHLFHIRVSGWTCSSPICLQLLRFMWLLGVELRSSWGQEWVLSSAFQNRKLNLWVIMSEGSNLYYIKLVLNKFTMVSLVNQSSATETSSVTLIRSIRTISYSLPLQNFGTRWPFFPYNIFID